jgi:hypothetical protein
MSANVANEIEITPEMIEAGTSCYNAVLKFVFNEINRSDLVEHIPAIPLYLEMGASSVTMLSFMEMGLSRITGRLLQDQAADSFMNVSNAQRWLGRNSRALDRLPAACRREVGALAGGT